MLILSYICYNYVSMHTIIFPQTYDIRNQYFTKAIQVILMGKQTWGTLLLKKLQKTTLNSNEMIKITGGKMVYVIITLYFQLALSSISIKSQM